MVKEKDFINYKKTIEKKTIKNNYIIKVWKWNIISWEIVFIDKKKRICVWILKLLKLINRNIFLKIY